MVRIVLADPQPLIHYGFAHFVAQHEDFVLLESCVDGAETLKVVHHFRPDVLVLDLPLPTLDGLGVLREIKNSKLETRTIFLTSGLDEEQTIEAMRLGVHGVFLKTMPTDLLAHCVRKVHSGGQWIEKLATGKAVEKLLLREAGARRLATILTPREIETLRLVAGGFNNQQIAERLLLKEGTVKVHINNIYKKLGLTNRVGLSLYAQQKGII